MEADVNTVKPKNIGRTVKMTEDTFNAIKSVAERDRRNVSQVLRIIVEDAAKAVDNG